MLETPLADIDFSRFVPSGGLVAWGQGCAEPLPLSHALIQQRHLIGHFRIFIGASFAETVAPHYAEDVEYGSYIGMGRNALLAKAGRLEILPCAYSQIADVLPAVDLLMVQAVADPEGVLRYAVACEYLADLARKAQAIIVEVNDKAPWSPNAPPLDMTRVAAFIRTTRPLVTFPVSTPDGALERIGDLIAGIVEDGATLQVGVGSLPDAALQSLSSHRNLGIHSGAIGDGVAALIESGVVTNSCKPVDQGVSVAGIFFGGDRLCRLAHGNRQIRLAPTSYTHDSGLIASMNRFVSINSAIEVDLTGAVNSEVANGVYVGGIGGAAEFSRAAAKSHGGLPIIALSSTVSRGKISRVVAKLSGPTTIARSDAAIVVTEFGMADLRGKSLQERRRMMLELAHPDFRAGLDAAAPC